MLLGVNIDHVATLRNARGVSYPSPLEAALIAETHGADLITLHLREDRRHIKDADVALIKQAIRTRMNLEMAMTEEMLAHALRIRPEDVCIVPEKRTEVTTEGGLDVIGQAGKVRHYVYELQAASIRVSIFIAPDKPQIQKAFDMGARVVALNTGEYAQFAAQLGMTVNAGHGLTIHNVAPIAQIPEIAELNIGHSLIAQAVFLGLPQAIAQMKEVMYRARNGLAT